MNATISSTLQKAGGASATPSKALAAVIWMEEKLPVRPIRQRTGRYAGVSWDTIVGMG